MECMNWPAVEGGTDDDDPVIVVLPQFLPVGPGQTFTHQHSLVSPTSFWDTFLLLNIWCRGVAYVRDHNANHSVTHAGPLFNIDRLELDENDPDSTEEFEPIFIGHPPNLALTMLVLLKQLEPLDRGPTKCGLIWVPTRA